MWEWLLIKDSCNIEINIWSDACPKSSDVCPKSSELNVAHMNVKNYHMDPVNRYKYVSLKIKIK